jgi:hypothetical protein
MKELFKAKPRRSKLKMVSGIKISDAHSSRRALRYFVPLLTIVLYLTSLFTLPELPSTVPILRTTLVRQHQVHLALDSLVTSIARSLKPHHRHDPLLPVSPIMPVTMLEK